ncbi:cytochrome P450, family 72, subfamily A, polypeptide 7 [Hibiscus trionum]|uniref:Cytochrome P450, family 72, subfamily A, polypeptide 7 n=1 Tax=Hibiscus trionum TaxID=183268 RepID=A0A9W7IT30_HIBTR|nr:cytochrome P450, family 72, subfamily A, polypeptide 7 [Hibiscus trionum]
MTMIVNETLRLYGPLTLLLREVRKEVRLRKLVFPANIDLLLPNMALHHDPHLWGDDVHLFKPERFAEGIARETKIAISMILQCYTISLSPAYVHSPMSIITLRAQHGIQIMLESLHNDA